MIKLWTIYDHPTDFPNNYIARMFEGETPTDIVLVDTLEGLRSTFKKIGLACLHRSEGDDAKIVETWF